MKKIIFSIVLLTLTKTVSAQVGMRPSIYGIADTVISVKQLQDSIANSTAMSFMQVDKKAVVLEYTITYTPVSGQPFTQTVKGRSLDSEMKYKLRSAVPGDKIYISHVKMIYDNHDMEIRHGITYTLQ